MLCVNTEADERLGVVMLIAIFTISIQEQVAAGGVYIQRLYPHSYCPFTDLNYKLQLRY